MNQRPNLVRCRWAAIGAAAAVTIGAGGLYTVRADSPASSFIAITPVRVLDTRNGVGLTGPFVTAVARNLKVTGTVAISTGPTTSTTAIVVPEGASAVVMNVTAVSPTASGFVSVRPGNATGEPTTSNLNVVPADIAPNSVTVELPTAANNGELNLYYLGNATGATTDLLIDLVGYYVAGGVPGPAGPPGATGPAGPPGIRGLSAWDVIPSGTTLTGEAMFDSDHGPDTEPDRLYVSFGATAPVALTLTTVNFGTDDFLGTDDDPTCTGTPLAPTAPSGKVCVYTAALGGVSSATGHAGFLPTKGFALVWFPSANTTDEYVYITWAYTAP